MPERVAIIGAGPTGLCFAKHATENNLEPVIFEKADQPGGLWIPNRKVWETMKVNGSKFMISFIDHPWPNEAPIFPNSNQVFDYLMTYVKKYSLEKFMKLNSQVEKISKLVDNRWEITFKDLKTSETKIETFKFLVISTGLNNKPFIPENKGLEKYMGKVMHSSEYKSNTKMFNNKRILVVGNSSSAVEIASDLVDIAKTVTNVFTRPYLIFKKLIKIEDPNSNFCNLVPVDFLFFNRNFTHEKLSDKETFKKFIANFCPSQVGYTLNPNLKALKFDLDKEAPRVAVSNDYIDLVKNEKLLTKRAKIEEFDDELIYFDDESYTEKDIVIFATGFSLGFDFFDENILEILKHQENFEKDQIVLFENTWHPDLENCAFIGLTRGLYVTGAELQAIYACKVFNGDIKLPEKELMEDEIRKADEKRIKNEHLNLQYPYGSYVEIVDNLARKLNILPDFEKLRNEEPDVYRMLWNNLLSSSHFLFKKDREKAIQMLKEVDEITNRRYNLNEADEIDCFNIRS